LFVLLEDKLKESAKLYDSYLFHSKNEACQGLLACWSTLIELY